MIRLIDAAAAFLGLLLLSPFLIAVYVVLLFDTGSPLFRQTRVGRHKKPFTLVKFRTMKVGTRSVATHMVDASTITKSGAFLRKTKLDELPQLWNVLMGDMSLVGPRPNLPTQDELISERDRMGVYEARPGITGLAQIRKVDMSTPRKLAEIDREMLDDLSLRAYLTYILLTIGGRGSGDRVRV